MTVRLLTDLARRPRPLSPFTAPAPASAPERALGLTAPVGEVAFTEWTTAILLRHLSWPVLRTDKNRDDQQGNG